MAGTLARFSHSGFEQPVPVEFGVEIEAMTMQQLKDIAALLARGDLQASPDELGRLRARAQEFGGIGLMPPQPSQKGVTPPTDDWQVPHV